MDQKFLSTVCLVAVIGSGPSCSGDDGSGQQAGGASMMQPPATMQPVAPSGMMQEPEPTGGAPAPAAEPMMETAGTAAPSTMEGTADTTDAGTGAEAEPEPESEPPASGGVLPPVDSTETEGPFQSEVDSSGPHYVWRPTELGKDGLKHPVFIWGTGAGATPDRYNEYFGRFATHGIVVVAPTPASLGVDNMISALDWILEQNETMGSDYYQKIDPERIGMGGHSQGSVATFDAEGMESRLKTTIHIAGGSFDGRGSSKVKTPTAYICGETDFALPNCETDFDTVEDQPTFFAVLDGVDHVAAARNAMPGMIAWLRWHLGGETERAAQFTGPDGEFHKGIWASQTKNWNY